MSLGETIFKLTYEISPIILTNGVADDIPGGMLPIVAITESINFVTGLLSGGDAIDLNNFFAHFKVLTGSSLIDNQIGTYPFANQQVAANAIVVQPLRLSMRMDAPAKGSFGYAAKLATMINLQGVLAKHNTLGGTYTIVTPSFIYENCLMTNMRDISGGESKQVQTAWQLDFFQPLITRESAQQAQNTLMSRMSNGSQVTPNSDGEITWSGPRQGVGNPASGLAPSVVPATRPLVGGSVGTNPNIVPFD